MKVIILAAGEGKRMLPLTLDTPKPLLKVGDKTFLDHIFDALPAEVSEALVVVKYLGDKIKSYLGDEYKGRKIIYVEGKGKGTALDFLSCKDFFSPGERFIIIYGDEIPTRQEIAECLKYPLSWLCCLTDTPELSGIAEIKDDGLIVEVVEKPRTPKSNWAAAGVMVFDTEAFSLAPELHELGEYYLSSLLDKLVKKRKVQAVKMGACRSFVYPEDLGRVSELLK